MAVGNPTFPVIVNDPDEEKLTTFRLFPFPVMFPTMVAEFVPEQVTIFEILEENAEMLDVKVTPFANEKLPPTEAVAVPPSFQTRLVAEELVIVPVVTEVLTAMVNVLQ